jgi:ATP-dependent DNA helicase RecG
MSSSARKSQKTSDVRHSLTSSIRLLPGVGTRREDLLRQLGIETIGDLLVYAPRRYIDRANFSCIAELKGGQVQSVIGKVSRIEVKPARGKVLMIAHLEDATGRMRCVWFNQPYLRNVLRPGDSYVFSGRVQVDRYGTSIVHPEYEVLGDELLHTGRIVPIYGARPGLSQKQLRSLIKHALDGYLGDVVDYLPESMRAELELVPLASALRGIHFPADQADMEGSRKRLAFDEVLLFQTLFALARLERKGIEPDGDLPEDIIDRLSEYLPFDLTESQVSALAAILGDVAEPHPMRRLLQGDVGCGKTVVGCLAAAHVCREGGQVALMCPTEILAEQHYKTVSRYLFPFGLAVGLVTGGMDSDQRTRTERDMESGALHLVVGTHALLSQRACFKDLRLIIIDEEQRFGVVQRTMLVRKAPHANLLVISATPIPRTLALTAYGDLDVAVINELPPGRGRHVSRSVSEHDRSGVLSRVASKISGGLQGYHICPAVEEGESGLADVETVSQEMKGLLGDREVELLTGRTPKEERARIIDAFRSNRIGLIVATTVIEVGMDIPSARVLVVEQAERFGLSQLHQMRGRVARSDAESYSYFIVSESASDGARVRVEVLESTFDGFEIAEKDLTLRGPGDVVGTRQHGVPDLRFARLPDDIDLMISARDQAFERVLNGDPSPEWQNWMQAVANLTEGKIAIV